MDNPGLWKLEPAVVNKPWGLVHDGVKALTGIRVGLGELWLASAQTGPGNYSNTVADPSLRKTLAALLKEAAQSGDAALTRLVGADTVRHLRENPHRGKTEAWYVRAVEGRTGVAAGPRTAEEAAKLKDLIMTRGLAPRGRGLAGRRARDARPDRAAPGRRDFPGPGRHAPHHVRRRAGEQARH